MAPNPERSILITGCSSGIGLTCAQGLSQRGWRVTASARKQNDVDRLADLGLHAIRLDLDEPESIRDGLAQTIDRHGGRLSALLNNGAYGQMGAVEDLSREALRAQIETNLIGWHDLTRQVIPVMRRQGHGRIVQVGSMLGFIPLPYRGAYVASKYALEGLTDTLRLELQGSGILISLIEPGPVATRFRKNAYDAFKAHIAPNQSVHYEAYSLLEARLRTPRAPGRFTRPPEAVLNAVIDALESKHPRIRYFVTVPSRVFALLRRILPDRGLTWLIEQVSRRQTD